MRSLFNEAAIRRFWANLPGFDMQLAPGAWFGEDERYFRLGFGYLPLQRLPEALRVVSEVLSASL